jgi:folylpolyglutamate synthase/dihydropteroate synthase
MSIKSIIKKLLGEKLMYNYAPYFHATKGLIYSWKYGRPSQKMILVGITGTKGKTTTTMQLGRMLNLSGIKTGYLSTGSIYLGEIDNTEQQILLQLEKKFDVEHLENWIKATTKRITP